MLVYCGTINIRSAQPRDVIHVVTGWLSQKTRADIPPHRFEEDDLQEVINGCRVSGIRVSSANQHLQCIRLSHGDKEMPGREWITEIGLRQHPDHSMEVTVMLRSEEMSVRVSSPIVPSVPSVVRRLQQLPISSCSAANEMITLDDDDATIEALGYEIESATRSYPLVVFSPTVDGTYLLDMGVLKSSLKGIGTIVQIPVGMNTRKIASIIGRRYAAWAGGANIIFPPTAHVNCEVWTRRLTPERIHVLKQAGGVSPESEILSHILHQSNPIHLRRHISFTDVMEQRHKIERERLRLNSGNSADYVKFLEAYAEEIESKATRAQEQANATEKELAQTADDLRRIRHERDTLRLSLSHVQKTASVSLPSGIRDALEVASKSLTPRESLLVIASLFPDRIEILPEAWRSADKSEKFSEKQKLFDLLWTLSTDYWEALVRGVGDVQGRAVFGCSPYSARESEAVEHNRHARQLRTFLYQGREIQMFQHLRIGRKPSIIETIRVHFEWFADTQKIVVGHCGPHLDHK